MNICKQVYDLLSQVEVSGHANIKRMNAALDVLLKMSEASEEAQNDENRNEHGDAGGELGA